MLVRLVMVVVREEGIERLHVSRKKMWLSEVVVVKIDVVVDDDVAQVSRKMK